MAAKSINVQAEWPEFEITSPSPGDGIQLVQLDRKYFRLASTVRYTGVELGVEKQWFERFLPDSRQESRDRWRRKTFTQETTDDLRIVKPKHLKQTDLASVPPPFRWWINTYGNHTPAALIHDRFIGDKSALPKDVTERHIDRIFRFMLKGSGEPFLRRWLLWAAVAMRTRFHLRWWHKLAMVIWILLAIAGVGVGVVSVATFSGRLFVATALAPILAAALWGRQAGAGLIIAYVGVPCLLLPALLAVPALLLYWLLEATVYQLSRIRRYFEERDELTANQDSFWVRTRRTWLSTASHPINAIADQKILKKYQFNRVIIAALGTLLGAVGLGVSMSSSGAINTRPVTAFGWPLLAGLALSVLFIRVPTPRLLRTVTMLTLGLFLLVALDIPWEWKLTMGVVGFVLSWSIAQALRFWLAVGKHTITGMRTALLALPPILVLGLFLIDQPIAAAQGNACAGGELTLTVDGQSFGDEDIDVVVENRRTTVTVEATSSLPAGTVVVELVETEPVPMFGVDPLHIWSGQLRADEDGGTTGPQEIVVERGGRADTFLVEPANHTESFDLVAGNGRYRALVTDANGNTCSIDGWLRIVVSPSATLTGRLALAGTLLGLAGLSGAVTSSGSITGSRSDSGGTFRPIGPVSIQGTKTFIRLDDESARWEAIVKVRADEKEVEREGVEWRIDHVKLRNLVKFSGTVDLSSGVGEIPLVFTNDPSDIELEVGSFTLDLTNDPSEVLEATLILTSDGVDFDTKIADSTGQGTER